MSDSANGATKNPSPVPAGTMRREERFALLQAQTRRHFLRSFTAGVGSMFLGYIGFALCLSGGSRRTRH